MPRTQIVAQFRIGRRITSSFAPSPPGRGQGEGQLIAAVILRPILNRLARGAKIGFGPLLASIGMLLVATSELQAREPVGLRIQWSDELLTIRGVNLPGGRLDVWYVEAFCRSGSTDRDWGETVIKHTSRRIEASNDGRRIRLRSTLTDGVVVDHTITAGKEEVDFQLSAHNPTDTPSQVHWGQPCVRVDRFTGRTQDNYLDKSFVFVDQHLKRMPLDDWATQARYVPGQVWCPQDVDRNDVNPRPLSSLVPSSGLIGCFSADEKMILATAWEPYQELFQGVIVCLHSDFRIGGLAPGETKTARGKLYLVPADVDALVERYERDFPEHRKSKTAKGPS